MRKTPEEILDATRDEWAGRFDSTPEIRARAYLRSLQQSGLVNRELWGGQLVEEGTEAAVEEAIARGIQLSPKQAARDVLETLRAMGLGSRAQHLAEAADKILREVDEVYPLHQHDDVRKAVEFAAESLRQGIDGLDPTAHGGTIPRYAVADLWTAMHGTSRESVARFDETYDYAETWAHLLAEIRSRRSMKIEATGEARRFKVSEWLTVIIGGSPHSLRSGEVWFDEAAWARIVEEALAETGAIIPTENGHIAVTRAPVRCDYCGDALPAVKDRANVPTTPDLQRLGFDPLAVVCPECVERRRKPRQLIIDIDTGHWAAGGPISGEDGARIAAAVLPGWTPEAASAAYTEWLRDLDDGEEINERTHPELFAVVRQVIAERQAEEQTKTERADLDARACAWSDYRAEYGTHGATAFRDFCAGWDAARGTLDIGGVQR